MSSVSAGGPEDITRIQALLKEMNVDADQRVVSQLLEIAYATTSQVLTSSRAIAQHCGKQNIDEADVQIAIDFSGVMESRTPDRSKLLQLAQEKNSQPLPAIRHNFGLKLPNDRFCLLQPNVEWRGEEAVGMQRDIIRQDMAPTAQLRAQHMDGILGKRRADEDYDA